MRPFTFFTLFLGLALAQTPLGPVPTRDVHALLWHPSGALLLGHHDGIVLWNNSTSQDLVRRRDWDAMNLAWGVLIWAGLHFRHRDASELRESWRQMAELGMGPSAFSNSHRKG